MTPPTNPAPYSAAVLDKLRQLFDAEYERKQELVVVLDPMCGVGRVHSLAKPGEIITWGVEIEPEWAEQGGIDTLVGDAKALTFPDGFFDITCTSPDYGNRMADHHNATDSSKRITYKHYLGRDLSPETVVAQWGKAYRILHRQVLSEMVRVTKPGGLVIINMKNFYKGKRIIKVTEWYCRTLLDAHLILEEVKKVKTPGMRFGANRERAEFESILVFRKPQ